MWYLKVSSSLLIAVALICMIQDAISLSINPKATEDQWSTLESSTDQNDLKKISKLCKGALNNFNEKLENTKSISNKKLPEPNNTTEDIANLVSDIKNQVKNASADLVTVRKLVQKTALRFRDTFKSLVSFTELDNDSVNKELESIKKITVDSKKPLVNRVIRSFGNRYDLNKLANKVLVISSDREKLKNNYDKKKNIAKKEFNSLWNSLSNHSKTVNDSALKALDTFFEGMKSLKLVKKKVKTVGEDALSEIKGGDDIIKLKNAVELAKSLKLKFEDEWDLDSGELTYSEEQKKPNIKATDNEQSDVQENEGDKANDIISTNNLEPNLPITEVDPTKNHETNIIPQTQAGIEKLPINNHQTSDKAISPTQETQLPLEKKNKDVNKIIQPTISETEHNPIDNNVSNTIDSPIEENSSFANTENKDKTDNVQPDDSNKGQHSINDEYSKLDYPNKKTLFNPDINNNNVLTTPLKDSIDNKRGKRINKITSREKTLILPWKKLIKLDNPHVSQQSTKCENLLNDVSSDFDNIKRAAKSSIQVTKSSKNLQKIENDTVKQFYDKMVDTNTKLCDYLVNAADDVCAKVTPINKRYETKFKNDPNIKRIKYLLGKQYDPNQYILKVLDDANHKNGIGGTKKKTYYKMLAVAHNLNHETKEMEKSALYAMNKIHEGQLAATNLKKKFNKEKASKACYIRNILVENENEEDKKNKDENKEKVQENINDDANTEPLNPDVNLDSVDTIQPSTVLDDNEKILNNDEDEKTLKEPKEFTNPDNQKGNAKDTNFEDNKNTKGSMEQRTQEPNNTSSNQQNKDNIETSLEKNGNNRAKRNINYRPKTSEEIESLELGGQNNLNKSGDRNEENVTDDQNNDENTSAKPKVKRRRKRIHPKDGKEISEEYETSGEEDDSNLKKSHEENSEEDPGSQLLDHPDNEHDTETPEHIETEKVDSDEENVTDDQNNDENTSVKPKVKRRRKRIDPKDGKEISEEYETSGEEDDSNLNKSHEEKSEEDPESQLLDHPDNEHDTETPEHIETEKVDSDEENVTDDQNNDENTSAKPKVKRRRKRIHPKDGKEISEEYETSGEEDDSNLKKSHEEKSEEDPESQLLDHPDNEHDTETPEHIETEKVDSDEENVTDDQNNDENTSVKPKVKRRRKRIDPKDGKEISEEYETSGEEDDSNLNKSHEEKSEEDPESQLLDHSDNEHDTETPEHIETEKVDSDEENVTDDQNNDEPTSVKPKVKRRRKRIHPKDGKEISEEYETLGEEDDSNLNKSHEGNSEEDPGSQLLDHPDNEHDTETPEHIETEKVDSDEENVTDDQNNDEPTSVKHKVKRRRKRIHPKDGKEISEEYETSGEEDDSNLKKSHEEKSEEDPESQLLDHRDNEHDTETPEHVETEKVDSDEENVTDDQNNDEPTSVKPKVKRRRKRIHPKDGKEISEEYETSGEEDDSNLNKSHEGNSEEDPGSQLLDHPDNEHDTETPEHIETEKVDSDEENVTDDQNNDEPTSVKHKVKRRRKRIHPKDGKEISEEYETSGEEDDSNLKKSHEEKSEEDPESQLLDHRDNEHDTETPEHVETEKVDSDEENVTDDQNNDEPTSVKPKVKRRRKRIHPKDGKEISEEYETSGEEDDSNLNKSHEGNSEEDPGSQLLDHPDNEHDTETPEHIETEKVDSDEENVTDDQNNDEPTSVKHKVKRRRKRIHPKDGKEISEEYETSGEEDDSNLKKSHEEKSEEDPESQLLDHRDNEHDTETPEHVETEKVDSDEENVTDDQNNDEPTSVKPKVKRRRKRIHPKDGKEISEEYETSGEEDDSNLNKSHEGNSEEDPESQLLDHPDNEHDTETPEHIETEKVDSDEENVTDDQNNDENTSAKPKVKRRRKRIHPKDGKEISEEYETSGEEDDSNLKKSHEEKSEEDPESQLLDHPDNEHDTETPEHIETEKVDSDEENVTDDQNNDENTSVKPKVKRRRKRIDPKDGKEISEEYETSGEEDDSNLKKSHEEKSEEDPESQLLDHRDNEHDTETPEHVETEKVDSDEENVTDDQNNDEPTSVKPKVKRRRKRIHPKDGKEISEEYETSGEEDDSNLNKSHEGNSEEDPGSQLLDHPDNEHDTETPEHIETEKVDSDEENVTDDQNNDEPTSVKHKVKRRRKRIHPKDGKEISEEYETSGEEDDSNLNKSHEEKSEEDPESQLLDHRDNEHDTETPEHVETEKVDSDEENVTDDQNNDEPTSVKPKVKRRRKRIHPKDGKEISEEYETSGEEDDSNLNKSHEGNSEEDPESQLLDHPDNEHDTETPEHVETEKVDSDEENVTDDQNNDETTSVKPKMKRRRKRIDPKDGKEISEENETSGEEDDSNLNKSHEENSEEDPGSQLLDHPDNEHDTETPEHIETEKVDSDEENVTDDQNNDENTSVKPKVKRRRKRIDPKDGKEISEEYETSGEEDDSNLNKSHEEKSEEDLGSQLLDQPYNEHDTETPEHIETEKVDSDEKNVTDDQNNDENTSVKPKVKRRRKRIDPKDGKEISEEYETSGEEDDSNLNKSHEEKSEEDPESQLLDHPDNEHDTETPEHIETEKVDSDEENVTDDQNNDETTSVKPKVKRRRKRIHPKDGKEKTEEYETSGEEDDSNLNKSHEEKSEEDPESQLLDHPDNEHDTETPEHIETEKVDSDEENVTDDQNNDENTSVKPKVKHRRKKIDPKDGKEISEEYETSGEENENKSNKIFKNDSDEILDPDILNNYEKAHDKKEYEEETTADEGNINDHYKDSTAPLSVDYVEDLDPEYKTGESDELDENENLNSVEGAELYGVDNDNIIPAADSMGEESSSVESSYEDSEQDYPDDPNNTQINNEQYDSDDQRKKIIKGHAKRRNPKNSHEISEEYDTVEEEEDNSPVEGKNLETPTENHGGESRDHESETPEYEDMPENDKIPENYEHPDHNQSEEHEVFNENEPEIRSNEEIEKSNEIDQQNDGDNLPDKKMRRRRKRKDPLHSHEISEEYDTVEEKEDNSPVEGRNLDTPTGNLGGVSTDHESETPEYENMTENDTIPENYEYPDHSQSEEHEMFNENEPEIMSNEEIEKSNEIDQQNDGDNLPDKKMRRRRKRKDPLHSHEISEEYDTVEEEEDNSPVEGKNLETPTKNHGRESTDHESETPEYEDMPENKIPENSEHPNHNQSEEHEMFNENEPEIRSNEEIEKSNEIDQQNDGDNLPDKKMRRRRKRKDPLHSHEISEEYDTVEEEEDNSPVEGKNLETPTKNHGGESTDHESETPEYEDMPENDTIPENYEYPDHNQSEEHEVFNENEPEIRSNEEIEKSNEIDQQNDGDNLPDKKMRRRRKRKDPLHSHEISEEYDTVEEEEDNSPVEGKNLETPTENHGGESTDHESETPEYEDMPENDTIPENYEYPDHNQSEEHEVFNENEPEIRSNEEIEKSNEIDQQNDGDNLPDKKMRRRRKRKDPLHSHEISEEYDTVEEKEDNSPVEGKNLETPTENHGGESKDHESETPEYEDMPENDKIPINYEHPDHNQSEEHEVLNENEPEIRSNEEIEKSNEIDQQNDGDNLPDKKMRRRRKRKDPLHSHEISEEYDTVEEEEDNSPVEGKNLETPTENHGGESTDHESETPEYEDMPENDTIPENYEYPDHNQSEEHEVFNENEPEIRSNEEIEKSNEIDQQNDGDNLPDKKMRRRRKRKDPLHSHEISEEYDTVEEEEDNSPVEGKNLETPTENHGGESTDHESETPEYEDMPENDTIPENYEYPDHNQSEEHEVFNENEPKIRSNEEIEKSNEIDQQNDGDNLPDKKMRRRRKRKYPLHSHEISEEYDTVEEEEDNSPVEGKNLETPTENHGGESRDHESETPEYEDMPENDKIPENYEHPDHNQSEEHEVFNENEPEIRSNEEIEKSNEIDQQNDGDNLPDKKMRRRRKRKDPLHSHEISEEYDTVEEEEDNSPVEGKNLETPTENHGGESTDHESETPEYEDMPENDTIPENYEYPDHNQSEEHEVFNENEPKIRSNEEIEKSNEIDQQNDGDNLPDKKMRRRRKRKYPLHSHEISEEYDTVEEEEDNSPVEGKNLETPTENHGGESRDHESETPEYEDMPENDKIPENYEHPDHNQSEEHEVFNENEPEIRSNEEIEKSNEIDQQNDGDNLPDKKMRRRRKRKDPLHSHEISEEYDTVEEKEDNSPVEGRNVDTPTGNLGGVSTDHESETPEYEDMPENDTIPENYEYPDHNQSEEQEMFNENEAEIRSNEGIEKSNEIDQQNDGDNVPDTKMRRRRKRKDPLHSHEISEEHETIGYDTNDENVAPAASFPNDVNESRNVAKPPRLHKFRRHRKSRQPKTINENDNKPDVVYGDKNVQDELPENGNSESTDIDNEIEQPELSEYSENPDVAPQALSPNDVDESGNVAKPRPRKRRRRRKSRQPKTVNENDNEPDVFNDQNIENNPFEDQGVNYGRIPYDDNNVQEDGKNNASNSSHIGKKLRKKPRHIRKKKIPMTVDEITPNSLDTEKRRIQNDDKSDENPGIQPNDARRNPPKKRRLRRIRTYMINKATNERIPINDETYTTTDGLPDTPKNKLEETEIGDSDDTVSNEDNDDYSSFLFKEYNSDQCKRDAYDRFKKVTSQDAKQIAYRSVLDTSEMRSNMLATIKNAIGNVKVSKTLNDIDQSLRTVSYSLKTGLKQTVSDLVTKVIPLAIDFLKTTENLKELYKNGPQSTHKMISNILESESTVPNSAKDVLKLISPNFDVDKIINNIFEKPFNTKSLKEKKAKAQRKLISLSKHMDTAISNIDCFVLSAMSTVGIGADTLKLLKSGRVIMSDKHPRAKTLKDAMGIIKSGKKIRNNDVGFTPTLTPSDSFTESDEDDDDEDPDQVAQKNEEFLKTVPDLDDNIPVPIKVPNKRQSLGVIVVHPDKQIEYKEVTDTSQLKKFVGDQTKKYKLQSKNKHPKFLKLNSKKLIDSMVADVKKKAEINGMSKKEMVEEIIKNLRSS